MRNFNIEKIGYPKTGNTLVNYLIKTVIPGYEDNPIKGKHGNLSGFYDYWRSVSFHNLIFTIRNYKECFFRNMTEKKYSDLEILDKFEAFLSTPKKKTGYVKILKLFDSYSGPKVCIYYEDLLSIPKKTVFDIFKFLKNNGVIIETERYNNLLDNLDFYLEKSKEEYSHGSFKSDSKSKVFFSNKFSVDVKNKIDECIQSFCPDLFNKYLIRYKECNIWK